jgi:hypothetical protein
MIDLNRYTPTADPTAEDTTTWGEHYAGEYEPALPECSSHHTYRETTPLEEHEVWVCPSCGRFSDTYASHSGGTHLAAPTDLDSEDAIIIVGRAQVPPSGNGSELFGDGSMDAALVGSPFTAKRDIKSFKQDVDWHPETGGSTGYRRWVPEWSVWAVRWGVLDQFTDHMMERGWIVINLPELSSSDT